VIANFSSKKVQNEKPHNLYSSPNISSTIQRSIIRWAGHVALTGEVTTAYTLARKPKRKRSSRENLAGQIGRQHLGAAVFESGLDASGSYENRNKSSGSIKPGKCID
jgi:hypothetical protein